MSFWGGFDQAVKFTNDAELASIFVDAIVFEATGKDPGAIPSEADYRFNGTEQFRGIGKYSAAGNHFNVGDASAWLFGKEGAWAVTYALTGRLPTQEEREAFLGHHGARE